MNSLRLFSGVWFIGMAIFSGDLSQSLGSVATVADIQILLGFTIIVLAFEK